MKKIIALIISACISWSLAAQSQYFPPITGNTWETTTPASLGWCEDEIPALFDYLQTNNSKAFIVIKDGKIVIEKYFDTFTQDSIWYWASAGKTLTAFTVGIAQQEGYLNINDTTSKYLGTGWTSCTIDEENKITIRHQLTMTTGLDDGVADNHCTLDTCLTYKADAGTRWAYHNGPYTMLDMVLENATGKTTNQYVTSKIKTLTGMDGFFIYVNYDHVFYSTPRSMARFGLLLLNKGQWENTVVLNDTAYISQMTNSSQNLNNAYGYLTWLNGKSPFMLPTLQLKFPGTICPSAPSDMFAALGKNGQIINMVPSQHLVVIRMGNASNAGEVPMLFTDTIWQKLNNVMCSSSSIKENTLNSANQLTISPNPANGNVLISLVNNVFDLNIYALNGNLIYSQNGIKDQISLNCTQFTQGEYIVKITTRDNSILTEKLLIK